MKSYNRRLETFIAGISFLLGLANFATVSAATTPSLGSATTYGVLSSTYTNTVVGTTVNGDVGFTTAPAVVPAGSHPNYGSAAPYATAGGNQGTALTALAIQPCTYTFAPGAVNLSTEVGHGPIGVYTPGVYCTSAASAAVIGAAGITLNGAGTYIFRIDGALDTVANSVVTLSGASACDIFWTPTAATTLGANSTFAGTDIDAAGITIGNAVTWNGRALAFGGTVTTAADTITVPSCGSSLPATLRVIKQVVNTGGGTAVPSDFLLHVKNTGSGVDISASGASSPGTSHSLTGATYVVSEIANASYALSFSGDCSSTGSITLASNQDKTCTLTNTYIVPTVVSSGGGGGTIGVDICADGDYSDGYYDGICGTAPATATGVIVTTVAVATGTVVPTPPRVPIGTGTFIPMFSEPVLDVAVTPEIVTVVPRLPSTGFAPEEKNASRGLLAIIGVLVMATLVSVGIIRKKRAR